MAWSILRKIQSRRPDPLRELQALAERDARERGPSMPVLLRGLVGDRESGKHAVQCSRLYRHFLWFSERRQGFGTLAYLVVGRFRILP